MHVYFLEQHIDRLSSRACGINFVSFGVVVFFLKAGVLPPHPRSLVTAVKNREALATGALTLDALEEAEKDEEAETEENTEDP